MGSAVRSFSPRPVPLGAGCNRNLLAPQAVIAEKIDPRPGEDLRYAVKIINKKRFRQSRNDEKVFKVRRVGVGVRFGSHGFYV